MNRPYINVLYANSLWCTDSWRIAFGCSPNVHHTAECCLPRLRNTSTSNVRIVFTCHIRILFVFRYKQRGFSFYTLWIRPTNVGKGLIDSWALLSCSGHTKPITLSLFSWTCIFINILHFLFNNIGGKTFSIGWFLVLRKFYIIFLGSLRMDYFQILSTQLFRKKFWMKLSENLGEALAIMENSIRKFGGIFKYFGVTSAILKTFSG